MGWDACNVRVRIDVDMYKMCTVSLARLSPGPGGSGPGQVTSQATRRALTCGSRADRPGTDASGVRCQVPAATDAGPLLVSSSSLLPARGRAFVRSFVPQVVEGGDTDQNVTVQASRTTVEADFLSRAVLVVDRLFLLFCFFFVFPTQPRPARTRRRRS